MKIRSNRKYFYPLVILALGMFSQGAIAQINFKAFKNITPYFHKDKEFYSPVLGKVALDTGLIHNLRFYGNYVGAYENDNRKYISDSPRDALSNLLKILFPSPAGQLATETSAKNNFARYVKTPETVALLLNFSKDCRVYQEQIKEISLEEEKTKPQNQGAAEQLKIAQKEVAQIKSGLRKLKDSSSVDFKNLNSQLTEKEGQVKKLIEELKQSKGSVAEKKKAIDTPFDERKKVLQEKVMKSLSLQEEDKKIVSEQVGLILKQVLDSIAQEKDSPYPAYTTEQVISAFFCEHFNNQQEIWSLLGYLDEDIIDKNQALPQAEDYLKEEDILPIMGKTHYNLDDLYDLASADSLKLITPYKPGQDLLSNGNTNPYDRKTDQIDQTKSFPDCVEISIRHIINLLSYDNNKGIFDLENLKERVAKNSPNNPYFKNLELFYQSQLPLSANAGDIQIRSEFNKVVGDLNAFDELPKKIEYKKGAFELNAGFLNFVAVFEKILGLTLEKFPNSQIFDEEKTWLENSLKTIFTAINPNRKYEMNLSSLEKEAGEISGTLPITVSDTATGKALFSFDFYSQVNTHAQIKNLKILLASASVDHKANLQSRSNSLHPDTAEESLWLMIDQKKSAHTPLYALFATALLDNDFRIQSLTTLSQQSQNWIPLQPSERKEHLPRQEFIKNLLKNILSDLSWRDRETINKSSPVIFKLHGFEAFRGVLIESVKGLKFSDASLPLLNEFKNLKKADLSGITSKELELSSFANLEALDLSNNKNLENLSLQNLPKFETFNFKNSGIKKIALINLENLENLEILKILNLLNTSHLEDLSLQNLPKLEEINLYRSLLKKIALINLENLKSLNLPNTVDLEDLSLQNLPQLKSLNLSGTKIKKIDLSSFSNLIDLHLSKTINLEELSLKNLPNLKEINLQDSLIKKIALLNLERLTYLTLSNNKNLEDLSLQNLPNLKRALDLSSVSLRRVELNALANLKELNLENTPNLEDISLQNLHKLEELDLSGTKIKKIEGIENLANLKTLRLLYTDNLEDLSLQNLPKLEEINLYESLIKKVALINLEGLIWLTLSNTPNLEDLSLQNLPLEELSLQTLSAQTLYLENMKEIKNLNLMGSNLKTIIFKGDLSKLKTIDLSQSKDMKKIEGIENLSQLESLNITGTSLDIPSSTFKVIK